jgi:hypothetical protein
MFCHFCCIATRANLGVTSRASGYVDSFALDSFRADKTLLFRTPLRLAHYAFAGVTL